MTHRLLAAALILSVLAPLRLAVGNETEFSSLNSVDSTYGFSRGTKVRLQASGNVNEGHGLGVLQLKEFKVFLDGQRIDEKKFDKLASTLGIKIGTIQVSRETVGESPETGSFLYTITFDYEASAYASLEPYPFESRKHMSIEFDKTGIKKVTTTANVSKEVQMD